MAPNLSVTMLEQFQVSPPPNTIPTELSLPLTFFDIPCIPANRVQLLLLYELPNASKTHLLQTIIPDLKRSLSLTLRHYLPVASNLMIYPSNNAMPELRYVAGDSVTLILAECDYDFHFLKGNHPRKADDFHPLFHKLPRISNIHESRDSPKKIPLLALQVTIFPNFGMAIGFSFHHVLGDGISNISFIKAWASINKFGGDAEFLASDSLPCFDRSICKDPNGLAQMMWIQIKDKIGKFSQFGDENFEHSKVRATYDVKLEDINKLKNLVLKKRPKSAHVSSFTVICAFVWTCLVKSKDAEADKNIDEHDEYFCFLANHRAHLKPALPTNYFGNCLSLSFVKVMYSQLINENEGFLIAAEKIGEAIVKITQVTDGIGILKDVESVMSILQRADEKGNKIAVSGSPKFDLYEADYGWGRPETVENVTNDVDGAIALGKSRNFEGGVLVGLSLPKAKMDAFERFFNDGLRMIV
ncbi:hypothetical protein ACH5RR_027947 [Cinchona calisaya]|uniref:Uncharacterized protein n=1 Tax=Cinchona calisaya TaxID=153742 RepID=A0ABD2YNQ3_9GENT